MSSFLAIFFFSFCRHRSCITPLCRALTNSWQFYSRQEGPAMGLGIHSALCGCRNVFGVPSSRSLQDKIDVYSMYLVRAYRVLVLPFSTLMLSCFKLLAKQIFVLFSSFSLTPIKLPGHIYTKKSLFFPRQKHFLSLPNRF